MVTVCKDLRIPIRCVKCQEYGHIQDTCIGVEKCANCGSEFHHSDKCNRVPNCMSCSKGSNHPSTSPSCPTFLRKCEALDGRYPENTMPYFSYKEGWTWEASPANPLQPQEMLAPPFQQASSNQCSICPQHQTPRRKEVRFEDLPPPSQEQMRQVDDGWTSVHRRQRSPQRRRQSTIPDMWGSQQSSDANYHAEPLSHRPSQ